MHTYTCADLNQTQASIYNAESGKYSNQNILTENLHIFVGALLNYLGQKSYYSGVIMVQNCG